MFGSPRQNYITRLLETAYPGANKIFVSPGLDFQVGD